jgi:hypothetical protein
MQKEIVNKVASSGLITFNLEDYYLAGDRVLIDIKDLLFEGLILKEKDFRNHIKQHNWQLYQNKFVAITCSADAIIPTWAFMLLATTLQPFARVVHFGLLEQLEEKLFEQQLTKINWDEFKGRKVVVKGCSKINVPVSVYIEVVQHLQPVVSSLMFGEPCSTVPLFKVSKSN